MYALFWILLSYFICQHSAALYWHWPATWSVLLMQDSWLKHYFWHWLPLKKAFQLCLWNQLWQIFVVMAVMLSIINESHFASLKSCSFHFYYVITMHILFSLTQTHILKQVFLLTVRHMLTSHVWRYQIALLNTHWSSWVQKHIFNSSRPTLVNHHQRSVSDMVTEQVELLPIPRCTNT